MKSIFKKSYENIIEDTSFIKLTFFSLLPYSIVFVLYLFYQTYFIITSIKYWVDWNELRLYIQNVFSFGEHNIIIFSLIIFFILAVYFLIPPIAESALIYYLSWEKKISVALGKWFLKFFPMFEYHGLMSIFSFLFFFIVVSRLYVVNMIDSLFIFPLLIVWFILIILFNFFWLYARFLIVLEDMNPFEALKESMKLVILNFPITFKAYLMYLFLYIRFLLNILVLIWIPLLVTYLFLKSNIANNEVVKYSVYVVMFILFLLTAYINSIIEAFFINVWFELFKLIKK